MLKVCASCKVEKTAEMFHKDKKSPTGLHYYCKFCISQKSLTRKLSGSLKRPSSTAAFLERRYRSCY